MRNQLIDMLLGFVHAQSTLEHRQTVNIVFTALLNMVITMNYDVIHTQLIILTDLTSQGRGD